MKSYDTITVDTSIFDQHGQFLEKGLLKRLHQFKHSQINFIISEIIVCEINAHLTDKIESAKTHVKKAIRSSDGHLVFDEEILKNIELSLLGANKSSGDLAKKRIDIFLQNSAAEVIPFDMVTLQEIVAKYFNNEPPFAISGKKKNEFPDAIALISIEKWAIKNNKKILAVSTDPDWKKFADCSEHMEVIDDLGKALEIFQPQNQPSVFALSISQSLTSKPDHKITNFLNNSLPDIVTDWNLYPEAISSYHYEEDYVEIAYNDFEYTLFDNDRVDLKLVESGNDYITIELAIKISCVAYCNFIFLVKDCIDKDYVRIGYNNVEKQVEIETNLLLTIVGNLENDAENEDYEIEEIEILDQPNYIDFEEIEPDFKDE